MIHVLVTMLGEYPSSWFKQSIKVHWPFFNVYNEISELLSSNYQRITKYSQTSLQIHTDRQDEASPRSLTPSSNVRRFQHVCISSLFYIARRQKTSTPLLLYPRDGRFKTLVHSAAHTQIGVVKCQHPINLSNSEPDFEAPSNSLLAEVDELKLTTLACTLRRMELQVSSKIQCVTRYIGVYNP